MKFLHCIMLCVAALFSSVSLSRTWYGRDITCLAAVKDPVVDLYVHLPIQQHPPLAGVGSSAGKCRRAHQALAQEVVKIVERSGPYVKIACENLVYGFDERTQEPQNTFWVHKKHLIFFDTLPEETLACFPGPFGETDITLVLRLPWKQYSLGTRFVHAAELDTETTYGVYIYSYDRAACEVCSIPRTHARLELPTSPQQQRAHFVKLAYDIVRYAQRQGTDQVIPYVWGGGSFVHTYADQNFYLKHERWERPGYHNPYTGYDCSELVFRLAQTSGIPYICKTTKVIERLMPALKKTDTLEAGDLIRFPGHVMIVGNIGKNELIEACGYGGGFGRVHIVPLSVRFEGIRTYKQLRQAYHKKMPLKLLARDGSEQSIINEFKLYKLL